MTRQISDRDLVRFWSMVDQTDDCWLWEGALSAAGYGVISVGGSSMYAHRASWLIHTGEDPGEMCVLHRCDTPRCIKRGHLFLGTRADNMEDKIAKARQHRGEQTGGVVLTDITAREALELYAKGDTSALELAGRFGVSESTMRSLINGKTWTHIDAPRLSRDEIVAIGKRNRAEARHLVIRP